MCKKSFPEEFLQRQTYNTWLTFDLMAIQQLVSSLIRIGMI